jgi:hypothetical protein
LAADQRLKRTVVFALYPGHMSGAVGITNARAWIRKHSDLTRKAVAAVSIEHLGASEWIDDPVRGYSASGENEIYAVWTTQGPMLSSIAKPALVASGLQRHGLLKPPVQITPGAVFHWLGIPHLSGIAGPTYLMTVSPNGEMDKFDGQLAARQIGFYADAIRRLDTADAEGLRTGDPSLGNDQGSAQDQAYRDTSATAPCLPA